MIALPTPPGIETEWSIRTLARHLCVAPAEVDQHLLPPDSTGEMSDLHSDRIGHSYLDAAGDDLGDCYLHQEAAERIAAELPTGLVARAVVAGDYTPTWAEVQAMARHLVSLGDRGDLT